MSVLLWLYSNDCLSLVRSGLSPGEIAGIVVGVLVPLVAAAVGGVIYYMKKSQVCKYNR